VYLADSPRTFAIKFAQYAAKWLPPHTGIGIFGIFHKAILVNPLQAMQS
jgi:hypothetical protein